MCKFELILKHFDLSKRKSRSVKKVIRRTENDKKTKNSKSHDLSKRVKSSTLISS
jgi:hypothetical protein